MDRADGGFSGRNFLEADESLEQIQSLSAADCGGRPIGSISPREEILAVENPAQDGFTTMVVRMEHFAHLPFI